MRTAEAVRIKTQSSTVAKQFTNLPKDSMLNEHAFLTK